MSVLPFCKMQSVGNDFVLVQLSDLKRVACDERLPDLARALCSRRTSIGSDGLLVLDSQGVGLVLRMFNPDGSEDVCGNGSRCSALYAVRRGWVSASHVIEHGGRAVRATVHDDGRVTTEAGRANFDPEAVPLDTRLHETEMVEEPVCGVIGTAVNVGSTHFVSIVDELPDDRTFFAVSPKIEVDPLFPERTSIIYTKIVSESELSIRIWERGAGETLGCGTGASAAAVVAMRRRGFGGEIRVVSKGGETTVSADSWQGELLATSSPSEVFSGSVAVSKARNSSPGGRQVVAR